MHGGLALSLSISTLGPFSGTAEPFVFRAPAEDRGGGRKQERGLSLKCSYRLCGGAPPAPGNRIREERRGSGE